MLVLLTSGLVWSVVKVDFFLQLPSPTFLALSPFSPDSSVSSARKLVS